MNTIASTSRKYSAVKTALALALAGSMSVAACSDETDEPTPTPAAPTEMTANPPRPAPAPAAEADIVGTAEAAGFNTLLAAVKAAGLVDALKGPGPLTVFAPTDEAFAKLPPGTVETLLKPENKDQLASVLKYHVVAGKVLSGDVVKLTSAKTLEGRDVRVTARDGKVLLNDSQVIRVDVEASNGVIHVIDAVLLPK